LRLLPRDAQWLSLPELGLMPKELNDLSAMLNSPSGMLLVAGPWPGFPFQIARGLEDLALHSLQWPS
jgi:hypothetical protein